MLTVRLLAQEGHWVWVNMVMHIRQPFICENGDPAIVCINQVITDSEASLFKMQSQLESSHIARSPEFLNPVQGATPSQIITQVSDTEQHMQSMPLLRLLNEPTTYYEAQVAITTAPSGGDSATGSGSPQNTQQQQQQQQLTGLQSVHHSRSGSGSPSDCGSESSSSSSKSHKEILRTEILNRMNLKRMAVSAQPTDGCKPTKRAKLVHGGHDHSNPGGSATRVTGSVVIAQALGMGGGNGLGSGEGMSVSSLGGFCPSAQVLAPMAPGQMFQELSLKDILIPETVALRREFLPPLTPPTPPYSERSDSPCNTGTTLAPTGGDSLMTSLRVDTTSQLPLSILTPENSPTLKDFTSTSGGTQVGEQLVPGDMTELEEALRYAEQDATLSMVKPAEIKVEKKEPALLSSLPELDTVLIEDYFNAVDRKSSDLKLLDIKAEPLSPPQSSAGSVSPVPSPGSCYTESVASPGSLQALSPASQVSQAPATMAPSPCSLISTTEPIQQSITDMLKTEADLHNLVNTVAEAILDVVKQGNNQQQQQQATATDVTGGFLLVSSGDKMATREDQTSLDVPDVEMAEEKAEGAQPLPDPVAEAALINELHQLDQLAAAAPSYGMFTLVLQCQNKLFSARLVIWWCYFSFLRIALFCLQVMPRALAVSLTRPCKLCDLRRKHHNLKYGILPLIILKNFF